MSAQANIRRIEPKQIETEAGTIQIFTGNTTEPSENVINRLATIYMVGFNNKPWDIYGWNLSPEKARTEFATIVSIVFKTGGALLSLEDNGITVGFLVVTDMGVIVQRHSEVQKFKKLPKIYKSPGQYLIKMSKVVGIPIKIFGQIGYIADVVVDPAFRGRGFGKMLLKASIEYLRDAGTRYILAWTVNSAMGNIMRRAGFSRISEIGNYGEGIDFLVHGRIWYPTLDIPVHQRVAADKSLIAEHYIMKLT